MFIGGTNPTNAEYVGPPHQEVTGLLEDLVAFVNTRRDLSPVVVAAIAHAQFESVHPHHDGNGRVGRCLVHATIGLAYEVGQLQRSWLEQLTAARARSGLRPPRADAAVLAALGALPDMPAFHARDLAQQLDRSWRAAQDAIEELVDVGIVKQLSAGKGNRLYEVPEIFALLDGVEHDPERLVEIGHAPRRPGS